MSKVIRIIQCQNFVKFYNDTKKNMVALNNKFLLEYNINENNTNSLENAFLRITKITMFDQDIS